MRTPFYGGVVEKVFRIPFRGGLLIFGRLVSLLICGLFGWKIIGDCSYY